METRLPHQYALLLILTPGLHASLLAAAGILYTRWLKFVWKIALIRVAICPDCLFL
ncbi:hypothetical protein [Macrococcus equipercicus]|uniref:Uncharacterized protein n=1 Tax=Macrococcus equipercicus TaxID=69967 RepID=A0A9Q9BS08_9STAP|nr:hypothetical protein [Macrococcus equipercicus]UTH13074.1 hypothetical protein KFV11_07280 [Macrococcus equipercicus]